jgi:hypothetical protein
MLGLQIVQSANNPHESEQTIMAPAPPRKM